MTENNTEGKIREKNNIPKIDIFMLIFIYIYEVSIHKNENIHVSK